MVVETIAQHHGAAASRLQIHRLGLWLFILSECFLFGAIISARYFLAGVSRPHELNQGLGLAITMVLLLSSLTAYRSEVAAAHGNTRQFIRNSLATIILGGLFLVGVTVEWGEAFEFFPPQSAFGTIFFPLTGLHAFHVISGLLLLGFIAVKGRNGKYSEHDYWPVEGAVKYWHFVDIAWVVIYPTIYLVS